MITVPKVKLNNGVEIPIIGTGAYALPNPESLSQVKGWMLSALKNGFRHIDTARCYDTEVAVGDAIRESGIPREEIFVTTKLHWGHHDRVAWSLEQSLKDLKLDYVDLYLMHWPQSIEHDEKTWYPKHPDGSWRMNESVTFTESWAEIEKLLDTRKVRAIGVCNFSPKNMDILLKTAKVIPAVNQVELHPYLCQEALREYLAPKGIALEAYTPSGYSAVRTDPTINALAEKYGITPNQLTLAWHIARGVIILPKSTDSKRQRENLAAANVSVALAKEDIAAINKLDRNQRVWKPDETGTVFGWTPEQLGWD